MDGREHHAVSPVVQQSQGPRQVPAHVTEGVVPDDSDMPQSRGCVGPQRLDLRRRLLSCERCPRPCPYRRTRTRARLGQPSRQPSRPAPRRQGDDTGDHRNCERRRCQPAQRRGVEGHGPSLSGHPADVPSPCRVSQVPLMLGHFPPLDEPFPPAQPSLCRDVTKGPVLSACQALIDVSAHERVDGRYLCARSTGHNRPISGTQPPARRDTTARSTGHNRPLDGTQPPARRSAAEPGEPGGGVLEVGVGRARRHRRDHGVGARVRAEEPYLV
jgi:hypothetical protein